MQSNLTFEQWDRKVIEFNGSILQSWQWGEFQKSLDFGLHRFSGSDFINQVIEIPLLAGKNYLYSARGPLGNIPSAQKDILELGKSDHKIVFARIEPSIEVNLPRSVKETQPIHNWMLDLEKSEDQLLIEMKPKTRYNINLSERKGVTVREGTKKDLIDVYKLLLETAGRGNFRLYPQNYYWQMFDHLYPETLRILIAEYQGKPLACMILTLFGTTATYLHGGSSQISKEAMAPYTLHWEAIKLTKSRGFKYYDFGGVAPEGASNHSWGGISRFKRSFGGFEVTYPGSFEIIFSPLWYNVYKNARSLRNLIKRNQ